MSKSVLISIRPQWCELIANGKKTIEARKTRPNLETPFKCYIYCTKGEERWLAGIIGQRPAQKLNGKVIGEFVCDYVKMEAVGYIDHVAGYHGLESGTCLTAEQLMEYGKWAFLYGWHISALQIYDNPKELSEFKQCDKCPYGPIERCNEHEFSCDGTYSLSRPPQSWRYVEGLDAK